MTSIVKKRAKGSDKETSKPLSRNDKKDKSNSKPQARTLLAKNSKKPPTSESDSSDSGSEFEVETILDKKIKDGEVFYRIKWRGYNLRHATWEPVENLGNAPSKIELFEKALEEKGKENKGVSEQLVTQVESSDEQESSVLGKRNWAEGPQKEVSKKKGKNKRNGEDKAPWEPRQLRDRNKIIKTKTFRQEQLETKISSDSANSIDDDLNQEEDGDDDDDDDDEEDKEEEQVVVKGRKERRNNRIGQLKKREFEEDNEDSEKLDKAKKGQVQKIKRRGEENKKFEPEKQQPVKGKQVSEEIRVDIEEGKVKEKEKEMAASTKVVAVTAAKPKTVKSPTFKCLTS